MTILAQSVKGNEYFYNPETAHKVNKTKATLIADLLNHVNFRLLPGHIWFIHEVDGYDSAYEFAHRQAFTLGKRGLVERVRP